MSLRTKILIVAALLLLGGGGWFLFSSRAEGSFVRPTPEQASKAAAVLTLDRDGDGLKDWEEELWKTDPLDPDSDKDGASDGEEVRQGRSPVKAGPGDELDKETIESKTVPGGGDWTETDQFSREFFARYLTKRTSGEPFTPEDEQQFLDDYLKRSPKFHVSKIYTTEDLAVGKEDGREAWHAYGNAVGLAIKKHSENAGENELVIFERALENDDEIDLANLNARVKRYGELASDLASIPVPKSIENLALPLINSIEALKESVDGMSLALTDAVHALSAATAYPQAINELTDAFAAISSFFKENKIVFDKQEGGSILTE